MSQWIHQTSAWQILQSHAEEIKKIKLSDFFLQDKSRFHHFSLNLEGLLFDYSKNHLSTETLPLLFDLAHAANLFGSMNRMRAGELINLSEKRAVLHTALRANPEDIFTFKGENVVPDVQAVLDHLELVSNAIRNGHWLGHTGKKITDVVNIGIGGSDLGPVMLSQALKPYAIDSINIHLVSNIDGADLSLTLAKCDVETTLFIIASKTFSTLETMTNAHAARTWFLAQNTQESDIARHFLAVTTDLKAAAQFGIPADNCFGFWDWVGGRYSVWSAVGLVVMIQIGMNAFKSFLAGGRAMDQHFFSAPLEKNMPVLLGLIGVWYQSFWGATTQAIIPYDVGLARFPAHLQQVDMESNGKGVTKDGQRIEGYQTGAVVWGEAGANAQHSFFQLLHQGMALIPCDFIVPMNTHYPLGNQHQILVANAYAQTEGLMLGKTPEQVRSEMTKANLEIDEAMVAQKTFLGNRPSNTLAIDLLTPYKMGMLLALYEHKVFVQGCIWGLNSFDQWGVEYGKSLAKTVLNDLLTHEVSVHDGSTLGLIDYFKTCYKK
ncbi:MAG: glucose-6-phosphate isomerase [Neisseriaceae bacterium]|nr:glucose-6-phosphate isomerase [Neisseriaceae bacterium]